MADNPFDAFDPPKESSPYDALLAAAPAQESSPYDALLTAAPPAPETSPYDALLAAAPEETSAATTTGPASTSPSTLSNTYDPNADRLTDPAAQARLAELSKRKFFKSEAEKNPLTPDEEKELRHLTANVPTGLEGTLLDPQNIYIGDPALAARAGVQETNTGFSTGKINLGAIPSHVISKWVDTLNTATGAEEDANKDPEILAMREAGNAPIIQVPKPMGDTVAAGIVRGLATTAEGLTTPQNVELMAALGGAAAVVHRVAAAGFAVAMAKDLPEQISAIGDAQTTGDKAEKITEAIATAAMIVLSAKHAQDRSPGSAADRAASMEQAVLRAKALNEAGNRDAAAQALREGYRAANISTGTLPPGAERALKTATSGREPSQPSKAIEPQVLDGLVRSRDALIRAGADPADIASVNEQLSGFDPAAISAAEARARQPQPPTPPPTAAEPSVAPGGPSGEGATAGSFKQAQEEKLKAASDLATTAASASEVSPLAAAEAAKLAADVARKANAPATPETAIPEALSAVLKENGVTDIEVHHNGEYFTFKIPGTEETHTFGVNRAPEDVADFLKHQAEKKGETNAPTQEQQQKSSVEEHPGVPQGSDVSGNREEIRQEDRGQAGGGSGAEPAAEVPAAEAKVAPKLAPSKIDALLADLEEEPPPAAKTPPAEAPPERPTESKSIAGPALVDDQGKILIQGKIGDTHADLTLKAAKEGIDATDARRAFVDDRGKVLSRGDAAPVAEAAGQRREGTKGPLHSEHLQEPPPPLRIVKAGKKFKIVNAADEQVGSRLYENETNANRALAKIGKKSTFGLPPSATGHDVIDSIIENGGIDLSGLSPEERDNVFPHKGAWRNALINNEGGLKPDDMASSIGPSEYNTERGGVVHGNGDQRTMFDLISKAIGERGRLRDQGNAEVANQKLAEKQARSFERAALTPKEGETATAVSDLKEGDEIEVEGEKVTVTNVDPDTGEVTLKDGSKFGIQKVEEGKVVYGELKTVETDPLADWPDIETPEEAKKYADKNELTDEAQPPVEPSAGSIAEQPPEAEGPGGGGGAAAPEGRTPAPETPLEKARRVLDSRRQEIVIAREEGDYELAASLARVIPKLERDLAALEKPAAEAPVAEPVELWQRTRDQVGNQLAKHREAVKDAVARKKPVPDEVLAEYAGSAWADKEISRRAKAEKTSAQVKITEAPKAPEEPPEPKKSFWQLMDENAARQKAEDAAITKARVDGTEEYTPAIRIEDGKVVKSRSATEGHGELSSLYPEQKVEHGFVNNKTGKFMNVLEVARERQQRIPKLAEGQDQGDLLGGGDVNTGTSANVTNEAGGTLVRVGGQIVAKLSQNPKGEFTPELNDAGKKLTADQKSLIDTAAADYTKKWRAAKVREGANKPLAAADVTTQTDMLPGAPESDVPLFEKPRDKIQQALDKAIDDLKTKPGELLSDPLFIKTVGKPALRAALQIIRAAYDAGKSAIEAIEEGMAYLRANVNGLDEEKAKQFFDQIYEEPTPATETPAEQAAPEPPASTAPPEETSAEKPSSAEPATPAETAQSRVVALRKSFTDAQREKMGLPAWDKPAALTNQEAWDEGQRVLAENPKAGEQLVDEMLKKPRPLNPYEKAILLHEEGVRDTEYHASLDAVNKASTEQEYLSAQLRLDAARDANEQFYNAARASGRASGQSLQAHKMALDTETWTLARMEAAIQARKPFGEKLTAKERAEIADLHKQLKAERERADKAEAELKNSAAAELLDKLAKEQKRQARAEAAEVKAKGGTYTDWWDKREQNAMERIKARRGKLLATLDPLNLAGLADELIIGAAKVAKGLAKFPEWFASMKEDLGDYFEPQAQAMFDESKRRAAADKKTFDEAPAKAPKAPKAAKTPEAEAKPKSPKTKEEILKGIKEGQEAPDQKLVYDLVRSKIEANPDVKLDKAKVSEIMQEVRDDLAPHFPDITEDQVRDAFTGHGKITFPSKEQINVKMRELRGAGDLISKIGEAARGEPVKRTGKQRDKPTQFQRDLTKELIRTMRENGINTAPLESMLKTAHDARVTRLKNAIEDVQAQISAGKRTPKTPGTPWTPEELALSQELGGLREKLDALLDEPDSDQLNKLMNRIEAVTEKLDTGNIEPKAKSQNVPTKAVAEATEKLAQLNQELAARRKALRESQNPPKTEEERKIAALEKEEAKLTDQIRTGNIEPPSGKATVDTKAVAEAKNRVAELRRQIIEARQAKRDALNPPKTEEEKTLAALEKRQRAAEEALRTGNLATKAGKPSVDTEKVTKAKADLKEINQKLAEARKKSAEGIQRELDRYKKMINAKKADLQRKIATGDVSKPPRNPLSPEKTAIAKPYKILQDKWETMKRRQELKSQAPWQKALRWTTYLGHEMLLLAPAVGAKLTGAALTTAGFVRPIRELVGWGVGKALPFLGEKADVQIAPSLRSLFRSEMKAAASAFMNIANDVGSTLRHGKSDFELEFGKEYSNEMVSYVGRFHGIFKTIPARQAFTATFLRLAEKYENRGLDITDPDVRFSIGTQALFEAIRAKFQDPNMAVAALKSAMRTLDAKSPLHGAITKALVHTEMPVLTVASNISWAALEGIYGLPAGTSRIAFQYMSNLAHNSFGKKGGDFVIRAMKDMSTEQADSIARQLKNGTVGAAAFLIGAYIYQNMGGVRQEGEHTKPGDVKPGDIRPPEAIRGIIRELPIVGPDGSLPFFNKEGDIPKELIHHPMFTNMQMGSTMMRVADALERKNGAEDDFLSKASRLGKGFESANIAEAADSPIGQGVVNVHKLIDPATRLGAEGNLARTLLGLTGPMAWLAKKQDIDPSTGEPTRRKAENLKEELELAIPGIPALGIESPRQSVKPAKGSHRSVRSIYR